MTRNFVRFLCTSAGYQDIRLLVMTRMDAFLNSTKLSRPAQDLLSYVAANSGTGSVSDVEVIGKLAQLRIKSKPMANFYTSCMRELMGLHPANLEHLIRTVIRNELGANRNPTNMQVLAVLILQDNEKSAVVLAHIFQELLLQPEDRLRSLRILLREIVRSVHYEFKFSQFALALMEEITIPAFKNTDARIQERMFLSLNSLICTTILLSCKPSIRDIAMSSTKTDVQPLIAFQSEVAVMQKNAVWWLHKQVPKQYRIMGKHYYTSLKQVLFLDDSSNYTSKDNWPGEQERDMLVSLCAEVPLHENTLMRLGVLGTATNLPLRPQEVLGIINSVVRRAAMLDSHVESPPLQITGQVKHNLDIIQMLLKLSEYKYYNVKFPEGYTPPQLVISSHYWRAWQILLILASFNPTTVGVLAWDHHPTLRGLMEMVITNNYEYPPHSMNYQETMVQEKQLSVAEESDILIFEGHLAASRGVKITRQNSQLLNQLMVVKEGGPMRKPPQVILDQTRLLAMELHLGHRLCKVREPDFLLDIIREQGTSKSMSWLAELVKSSENSFELLPVPCLCEFLLQDIKNTKRHVLLKRLQSILLSGEDSAETLEIISYFISKMSGAHLIRYKALTGIKTIFNRPLEEQDNEDWLLVDLVNIPQHKEVVSTVCRELRKALYIEQSISLISAYVTYMCRYCLEADMAETALDMATAIIKRTSLFSRVLQEKEAVLVSLLQSFHQLILTHKGFETVPLDCVSLPVNGTLKHFSNDIIQAVLVLLAQARGRDVGSDNSVSKLMDVLFSSDSMKQLARHADILCTDSLIPTLLGSGVSQLQELASKNLTHEKMIQLLKGYNLPETTAQFLLERLDSEMEELTSLLIDEDELLAHVRAWRLSVSGGEQLEAFLAEKAISVEKERVDYYAKYESEKSEVKMETDTEQPEKREWADIFSDIFENDSVQSQSRLLSFCISNKNIEEICLNLFLWVKSHNLPSKHEQFMAILVQILSQHCTNKDLLEKLLVVVSPICKSLEPLHRTLFPDTFSPANQESTQMSILTKWCEKPESEEFSKVLTILGDLKFESGTDIKVLGSVWQKVLKTSVCNNGMYGIKLEPIIKMVISKMIENPKTSGMFMDWLQVLSPEFKCFKLFLNRDSEVAVSLQRYILNVMCSSCGWETLHECINSLLAPASSGFDDSLILDFLQGCCNNERIWQGANSKRGTDKGNLKLNREQLWKLCCLIMAEVEHTKCDEGKLQDKQFVLMSWRLPLILSPFHRDLLPDLVCKLQHYTSKHSKLLALSLYLADPSVFSQGASVTLINGVLSCKDIASSCDALIHQLVNNVCDKKKNSATGYVLLRRLAAYHPAIILRQLDLMTSALGNPTRCTKNEFIQANNGGLFISIIGILESLGPYLFNKNPSVILKECLEFAIVHAKHDVRLYTPTILKLAHILLLFLEKDRTTALKLLNSDYVQRLKKMEGKLREPLLTRLLDCVLSGSAARTVPEFDGKQMGPYLSKLSCDSPESLGILQDLDAGSNKKPGVLGMFLSEICRRMTSDVAECRALAHKLATRHVRHAPKDSRVVLGFVEQALRHPHPDVVKSAVVEMPELVLLSGSETPRFMKVALAAVARCNVDISGEFMAIIKTVITSSDLF